jgi:hypothetical protein
MLPLVVLKLKMVENLQVLLFLLHLVLNFVLVVVMHLDLQPVVQVLLNFVVLL